VGFWVGKCKNEKLADAYTGWVTLSWIFVEEVAIKSTTINISHMIKWTLEDL